VEKVDGANEEADLLVQRDELCDKLLPEAEAALEAKQVELDDAKAAADDCWLLAAANCPIPQRRAEIKLKAKQVSVLANQHARRIQSIRKPRKMDKSAPKPDDHKAIEEKFAKKHASRSKREARDDDLLFELYEPFQEDPNFSLEVCRKKMAILRFYHKSLRQKIEFCNDSRIYADTVYDAYSTFIGIYEDSLAQCEDMNCTISAP
jgi:hypothetical protein